MDDLELWLLIVSVALVVVGMLAQCVPTRREREDTTAYWKRKIESNGKRQQWGAR